LLSPLSIYQTLRLLRFSFTDSIPPPPDPAAYLASSTQAACRTWTAGGGGLVVAARATRSGVAGRRRRWRTASATTQGTCGARRISATATIADRPRWWPVRRRGRVPRQPLLLPIVSAVGGPGAVAGQARRAVAWVTSGARLREAAVRSGLGGLGFRRTAAGQQRVHRGAATARPRRPGRWQRWALFVTGTGRGGLTATEQGQRRQFLAGSIPSLAAPICHRTGLSPKAGFLFFSVQLNLCLLFVLHCLFVENARVVASCEFRFSFRSSCLCLRQSGLAFVSSCNCNAEEMRTPRNHVQLRNAPHSSFAVFLRWLQLRGPPLLTSPVPHAPALSAADLRRRVRSGRALAAGAEAEGGLDRADGCFQCGGKDDGGVLQQEAARVLQVCEEFPGVTYLKEGDFVNDDVGRGLSDGLIKSGACTIFMPHTRSSSRPVQYALAAVGWLATQNGIFVSSLIH
ncbi:hypothetical protein EJB05_29066, partial [Eragrostis curvula]